MKNLKLFQSALILLLLCSASVQADETDVRSGDSAITQDIDSASKRRRGPPVGWFNRVRAGYLHQFKSDTDSNNSFAVNRFAATYSIGYGFTPTSRALLSAGYTGHNYSFDNKTGGTFSEPWNRIDSFRLSAPLFFDFAENWNAIVVPTVRTTAENGASFSDGVNGGVITGVGYRFGDSLLIGPGIGVLSQIEDDPSIFPILIIDWKITDEFTLATGRGFGSTQGPGLSLAYKATKRTSLFVLGRYERLRFRLKKNNPLAPNGVGEDRSFPVLIGVNYRYGPLVVNASAGVELEGKLRLEDENGDKISSEGYDVAPILGISASAAF